MEWQMRRGEEAVDVQGTSKRRENTILLLTAYLVPCTFTCCLYFLFIVFVARC